VTSPTSKRILILFAHPALQHSRAQLRMLRAVKALPFVTVHDLYEAYPDLFIDIEKEKQMLLAHDIVVFQHPFYWYSCPAILKEWMDQVLEFGWAYGPGGENLKGKWLLSALSTGGGESAYHEQGRNRYALRQFLLPFDQTGHLCGMPYLAPFLVQGAGELDEAQLDAFAASYARTLTKLADGSLRLVDAMALNRLNEADHAD
jgi:glutathione-regulated potassium-efflux system ancillary protein KefG